MRAFDDFKELSTPKRSNSSVWILYLDVEFVLLSNVESECESFDFEV